jgi:hypothetical protein
VHLPNVYQIASFLNLHTQSLPSFSVMVGNGEQLRCSGFYPNVPLLVDTHRFGISFYVLPIQGADIVLGVQWLQTLGPFVSDFTVPSMQFYHDGSLLTITGSNTSILHQASFHQLTCMIHTNSVSTFHSISMIPTNPSLHKPPPNSSQDDQSPTTHHPDIQPILTKYKQVFSTPHGLPHRLPLLTSNLTVTPIFKKTP